MNLNNILNNINDLDLKFINIKNNILSTYTKELFGFPPGKNKQGQPPKIKQIEKIIFL